MMQLTLAFRPGLTSEFKTLRAVTHAAVLRTRAGVNGIAPAVDMSPSQLGRKLQGNPDDPHRTLDIDDWCHVVEELVVAGDLSPLFWLLEKFQLSTEQQKTAAVAQLAAMMPRITELLAEVQTPTHRKVRNR